MTIIAGLLAAALPVTVWLLLRAHTQKAEFWRQTAIDVVNQFAYYIPDPDTGCWEWQKGKDPRGYGRVARRNGKSGLAHRAMYEMHRGPVPSGLVLDHLCCNTSCVNPDHLEAVTPAENTRRWRSANPEEAHAQWRRVCEQRHPCST